MRTTVAQIVAETASKHKITVSDILGQSRKRDVAWPRQEACFRVFTECPHISYPEMGRRIGGRDHTTCLYGVHRHCERIGITYEDAQLMRIGPNFGPIFSALCASYARTLSMART